MDFPQFLEKKFLEWQQSMGGRRSVAEFARWNRLLTALCERITIDTRYQLVITFR